MTDVSEIAERLRAVLNDGLSSVAICNKNDLRAILDDRERLEKAAIAEQKYSHSLERSISDSKARISQLERQLADARGALEEAYNDFTFTRRVDYTSKNHWSRRARAFLAELEDHSNG